MASESVPPSFFSKTMPKRPSPRLYHRGRAGKMLLATVVFLGLAGGGIWSLGLGRHDARADLLTYTVHYEQLQPIVHVSGDSRSQQERLALAKRFATTALERLDAAQKFRTLHERGH